jgi:hypothetical protein
MFDNGSLLRRRKRFKNKLGARAQENPNGNTTGSNNESSSYENNQFEGDEEFEDDFDTNMNDDNDSNDNEPGNFDLSENQHHQALPKTAITGHINSIDAEMIMMKKKQDILPYLDNAGIRNDLMLSEHEKQQINVFLALQKTNELRSFEQASPLLSQMMFGFKQNPLVNTSLLVNAASIQQQHSTTVKNLNINALPNSSSSPISSTSSSSSSSPSSTSSSIASSETQHKQAPSSKASSSFSIDSLIGHGSAETSQKTSLNKLNSHSLAIKKSNKQHTAKNLKEKLAKLNEKSKSTSFESSKSQESANNSNLSNGSSSRESSRSRNGDEEATRSSNNSSRCESPAELSEQHKTNTSSSGVKAQGLFNPLSSNSYAANPYLAQQHASMLNYFNQSYLNSQQNPNLTQAEAAIRLRNSLSLFYSTQLNNQSGNQLGLPLDCSSTSISSLSSTSSSSSSSTSSISNSSNCNASNSKQNDPVSLAAAIASASMPNFPHNLIQASSNNFKQLNNQNSPALTPNQTNNQQQNLFKMFNEALLMRAAAAVSSTQQHHQQQNNQNLSAMNNFLNNNNNTSLSLNQNSNVNQTSNVNVNELQNVNFSNILPLFLPMHS